jgi:serine protease Do
MAFTDQGVPTQGLGFAIPAETVRDTVVEFKRVAANQSAPATPPPNTDAGAASNAERFFGMQLQELTSDLTDALGLAPGRGVLVSAVEPQSPAAAVGIERGLVIYRVGKYDVKTVGQVEKLLARARPGMSVSFTVGFVRSSGQSPRLATVTLTAR